MDARRGQRFVVAGDGVPASEPFQLHAQRGDVKMNVDAGSSGRRAGGVLLTSLGAAGVAHHGVLGLVLGAVANDDASTRDLGEALQTSGGISLGAGVATLAGGIVLIATSRTRIDFAPAEPPGKDSARARPVAPKYWLGQWCGHASSEVVLCCVGACRAPADGVRVRRRCAGRRGCGQGGLALEADATDHGGAASRVGRAGRRGQATAPQEAGALEPSERSLLHQARRKGSSRGIERRRRVGGSISAGVQPRLAPVEGWPGRKQRVRGAARTDRRVLRRTSRHRRRAPDAAALRARSHQASRDLAHEIHHALQHQHFDLPKQLPNADAELAVTALVEGDAQVAMGAYIGAEQGAPVRRTLRMLKEVTGRVSLDEISHKDQGSEKLSHALPIFRARLTFPYVDGMRFVTDLYRAGGFRLVDRAYSRLPDSTEQVLHPDKYIAGERPTEVADPRPPSGYERVHVGRMGELQIRVALEACVGADQARARQARVGVVMLSRSPILRTTSQCSGVPFGTPSRTRSSSRTRWNGARIVGARAS